MGVLEILSSQLPSVIGVGRKDAEASCDGDAVRLAPYVSDGRTKVDVDADAPADSMGLALKKGLPPTMLVSLRRLGTALTVAKGLPPTTLVSLRRLGAALTVAKGLPTALVLDICAVGMTVARMVSVRTCWLEMTEPLPVALVVAVMLLVAVMVVVACCVVAALLDATGVVPKDAAGSDADVEKVGEGGALLVLTAGAGTPEALPVNDAVAVMLLVIDMVAVMLADAASPAVPTDAPARAVSASSATAARTNDALIAGGAVWRWRPLLHEGEARKK